MTLNSEIDFYYGFLCGEITMYKIFSLIAMAVIFSFISLYRGSIENKIKLYNYLAEIQMEWAISNWKLLGLIRMRYAEIVANLEALKKITFGNKRDAVSFVRRSFLQNKTESLWPLYRLSRLLYERNWSIRRRQNELKRGLWFWRNSEDFVNKNSVFEFSEFSGN